MTDIYVLVLILGLFYLHDCSLWLERDSVAFFPGWTGGWRPERPHPLLSRSTKGLLLSFRLPPLRPVYLCHPWRTALSPTHACPTRPSGTGEEPSPHPARLAWPYEAITSVSVAEDTVTVNGQPFMACDDPSRAMALAWLLRQVAALPPAARPKAILASLVGSLDLDRLRSDLGTLSETSASLRFLCNALFLYLFLVAPGLLAFLGFSHLWPALLAALVVLVAMIGVTFRNIHARLWPEEQGVRRNALCRIAFYPPTAIRAHDYLAHRACAEYHPLAVAFVLCAPSVFDRFARQCVRELHHPLASTATDPAVAAAEEWFRSAQEEAIRLSLRAWGLDADAYLQPPPRTGTGSLAFCPRCDTEYAVAGGACADCPGIALVPYDRGPRPHAVMCPPTARVSP